MRKNKRSKFRLALSALVIGVLVLAMGIAGTVEAQEGDTLYVEARDLPNITIDGVLSEGEWDSYFWFTDNSEGPGTGYDDEPLPVFHGYVTNDDGYLYVAMRVEDEPPKSSRGAHLYIDIPPVGVFNDPDVHHFVVLTAGGTTGYSYGVLTENVYPWDREFETGTMPDGVEIASSYDEAEGIAVFEFKIPLSEINAKPGDVIGLRLQATDRIEGNWNYNFYPDVPGDITPVRPSLRVEVEGLYASLELEPFSSIQSAIDAANSGDTITVAAGTYHETHEHGPGGGVAVDIPWFAEGAGGLTIRSSDGPENTIIDCDMGGADGWAAWGVQMVSNNITFTGFTVKHAYSVINQVSGKGHNLSNLIITDFVNYGLGPAAAHNCTFSNITIHTNKKDDAENRTVKGIDMQEYGSGGNSNNTFQDITIYDIETTGEWGVSYGIYWEGDNAATHPSNDNTFTNLMIYDISGTYFARGLYLEAKETNAIENATFSGGSVYNVVDSDDTTPAGALYAWGIYIRGGVNNLSITGFNVTSCLKGIYVSHSTYPPSQNVDIHYNNIAGNTEYGVQDYNGDNDVNATNNWWGANDGPSHSPGSGDKVSDNVNYTPYLMFTVSASPTSITADGTSTSTITAQITDSTGVVPSDIGNLPSMEIHFATDKGTITDSSVNTDDTGKAVTTLKSSTTSETATVTAKAPPYGDAAKASATVVFGAGPSTGITLSASPASIIADGSSTSTITATVKDANGNPVADGTEVTFKTTLVSITSSATTSGGIATATLTAGTASGTATVTATANGISNTIQVDITADVVGEEVTETIPEGETNHPVEGPSGSDTTVEVTTTAEVTVTITNYTDNPHPEVDPPPNSPGKYSDISVSNPDAITWPMRVEVTYTDAELAASGVIEETLKLYYFKNGDWHQCSVTGCDTANNIVWANMTKDETSGSPISLGGSPAITGSIKINDDATYTNSKEVTLTLSATNAKWMQFSNDNSSWSSWENYTTSKSWTLTSGDGTKTVYVKFKDAAEAISDTYSDTIILDTAAPTGSISINNGAAYTNSRSATLGLSATGASAMCFSNDNSTWSPWETYATSKSWTLVSGDGTKRVYVKFKDAAGNVSETYSDTIILDTTPPNVAITSPKSNTYVGGTLDIIGTATDTHFRGYKLYYGQGENPSSWNLIKESSSSVSSSILGTWDTTKVTDGTYTIKLWADDKANNSAETKVKIFIDNTPPEIENLALDQENFIPGDYASSTPTILATLTDTGSGIDETTIDLRIKPAEGDEIVVPASSVSFNSETGEMSYTVTEPLADSEYTVSINVKDEVGNSAEEKTTEFVIESELAMKKVLNYPNPFSSGTKFTYILTRDVDEVTIKVYTVAGEIVKTIDFASSHVGYNEEEWDGINDYGEELANGTYIYKIAVKLGDEKVSKVQMLTVLK